MPTSHPTAPEQVADTKSPVVAGGAASPVQLGDSPHREPDVEHHTLRPTTLPLVTLVLGIAGAALGVVVVWYPAAIAIGLCAVAVGGVALRRLRAEADPRARSRAIVGTMLGAIAIVLGVSAALLLPHAVDRVDNFFATLRTEVNHNVKSVNSGLRSDVNRLDRSTSRDLRRAERQNRSDLDRLERRSNASLGDLTRRLGEVETKLTDAERRDLANLEQSLRTDVRNLDAALRSSSDDLGQRVAKLEEELAALQHTLKP